MAKIAVFYATAGEGHKKVAEAIRDELRAGFGNSVQIDCFDSLDFTHTLFKKGYPNTYHFLVTKVAILWGWFYYLFDLPWIYRFLRLPRRFFNKFNANGLERSLQEGQYDLIVSTHFLSAEVASALKKAKKISSIIFTVITDFSAHSFWINLGTDYYAVMHSETADTAIRRGALRKDIYVTGIPVRREFLEFYDKIEVLQSLGLASSGKKTILITSGRFGMGPTIPIIRSLERFSKEVQIIVVCGYNSTLRERLEGFQTSLSIKVLGFVDYMPKLMSVSDLVIAKAGGSTICESLAVGIPLVIFSCIPGQEERNAELLKKYNAARFIQKPEEIVDAVEEILHNPESMKQWRKGMRLVARPFAAQEVVAFARSFLNLEEKKSSG